MNLELETMENGGDFELSKFWVLLRLQRIRHSIRKHP